MYWKSLTYFLARLVDRRCFWLLYGAMIPTCCGRVDLKMTSTSWTINSTSVGLFTDLNREETGFNQMSSNSYLLVALRNATSVTNTCVNNQHIIAFLPTSSLPVLIIKPGAVNFHQLVAISVQYLPCSLRKVFMAVLYIKQNKWL